MCVNVTNGCKITCSIRAVSRKCVRFLTDIKEPNLTACVASNTLHANVNGIKLSKFMNNFKTLRLLLFLFPST